MKAADVGPYFLLSNPQGDRLPRRGRAAWRNRSNGLRAFHAGFALQGFHQPHRTANCDHHCHPTHLFFGEEDQLLVLPDATISV